jgi:hypothetical protein
MKIFYYRRAKKPAEFQNTQNSSAEKQLEKLEFPPTQHFPLTNTRIHITSTQIQTQG